MKYVLITTAIVLFLAIGFFLIYTPYETTSSKSHTFYINEDFDTVRRVLVRAPSLEKMVELGNGTLVEKKQEHISLGINRILDPNWLVEAQGYFKVKHKNKYLKDKVLKLKQDVRFTKDYMEAHISLTEPAGTLLGYDVSTRMDRRGDRTRVHQVLTMTIQYKIIHTRRLKGIVESELDKAAKECLRQQEKGLNEVIDLYKDRRIFIPIKEQ